MLGKLYGAIVNLKENKTSLEKKNKTSTYKELVSYTRNWCHIKINPYAQSSQVTSVIYVMLRPKLESHQGLISPQQLEYIGKILL